MLKSKITIMRINDDRPADKSISFSKKGVEEETRRVQAWWKNLSTEEKEVTFFRVEEAKS